MTSLYDQISRISAADPRRVIDRLRAEIDVRGWAAIADQHADELRKRTPSSGRGHAVIEADIAMQASDRLLGGGAANGYTIGERIAQAVMWTAFALINLDAAEAAFEELCARGVGDSDTPLREVPLTEAERTFASLVLGQRVGDDATEW